MENANQFYREMADKIAKGEEFALISEYSEGGIAKRVEARNDLRGGFKAEGGLVAARLEEYYAPRPRLIVFGGGHIALPVCKLGSMCGFDVIIYDDRPYFANEARFPEANQVICQAFEDAAEYLTLTELDYVVIVTRGHRHDGVCLRFVLGATVTPHYLGMIGSKRRVAIVRKQVLDEGFDPMKLELLCSPIGLDIGSVTPEEIAVAIIAQVIEFRRREDHRGHYHGDFAIEAEIVEKLQSASADCALVTVVRTDGSTPRDEGARMLVYPDGTSTGSIGGGCAEADVARMSREVLRSPQGWLVFEADLTDSADEDGMVCGGTMKILIERVGIENNVR